MYAKGATDLNLPAKVSYSPLPAAPAVVPAGSMAPAVLGPPPLVRAAFVAAGKSTIPWQTVGIVAGVVAVGGLAVWMMMKTSRGFKRPAMAGLAGHRRSRRRHRR